MRLQREYLARLLGKLEARGATELLLKVGVPPSVRIEGRLRRLEGRPLTANDTQAAAFALGALAGQKGIDPDEAELDFELEGVGRFRAFLYRQRGLITAVVRTVPAQIPTLAELDLALSLPMLLEQGGLWLICGRMRDRVLAALVQEQVETHPGHTVVIEEDAGFPYRDGLGVISVRRLGADVPNLATAVRTARRMGADLLVTCDIRDRAAASEILDAAEGGLPTIASLGFVRVADCIPGYARLFEPERRDEITLRLEAVVGQTVAYPSPAMELARAMRTSEDPPPIPRALWGRP